MPRFPLRLVGCVLLVVPLVAACTDPAQEAKLLQGGYASYAARQVDEAEASATKYITDDPNAQNIDEAYYLRGLARLAKGNKGGAAQDLQVALQKSSRADLKCKAYRALGDIAWEADRWQDSLDDYQKALALAPASAAVTTHCLYRSGASLQAMGQWSKATPYFQRVVAADASTDEPELKDRAIARMYATHFALQFGAFVDLRNAAELRDQLKTAGITAGIESERRENQVLFLVRNGTYETFAQADASRAQVQSRYPLVIIVP